jgi:hypothetical protein
LVSGRLINARLIPPLIIKASTFRDRTTEFYLWWTGWRFFFLWWRYRGRCVVTVTSRET